MSGGMNLEQDAIVRIRSLNKTFTGRAGKVTALDGIDLDIRRGEIFLSETEGAAEASSPLTRSQMRGLLSLQSRSMIS